MIANRPITLRPYQADDVLPLYETASESIADIYPWMPWHHPGYTITDSRSWVESRHGVWGKPDYDFVIVERATDVSSDRWGRTRSIGCIIFFDNSPR